MINHIYFRSKRKVHTDVVATGLSDHEMTFTIFDNKVKKNKVTVTKRWLKDDHYELIAEKLGEYDLQFTNESADEATTILSQKIIKKINCIVLYQNYTRHQSDFQ